MDFFEESAQKMQNGMNQDPFMSNESGFDNNNLGGSSVFDTNSNPGIGFDNNYNNGNYNNGMGTQTGQKDWFDTLWDIGVKIFYGIINICVGFATSLKEIYVSFQNKGADDTIDLFTRLIISFIPATVLGILCIIIGFILDSTINDIGFMIIIGCTFDYIIGVALLSTKKLMCYKNETEEDLIKAIDEEVENNPELQDQKEILENLNSEYEESFDDIINSILGEEEPEKNEDTSNEIEDDDSDAFDFEIPEEEEKPKEIEEPDVISGMGVDSLTRERLWELFAPLFPIKNAKFDKVVEWTSDNEYADKWVKLLGIIGNVFADAYGISLEEVTGDKKIMVLKVEDALMYTYIEISKPPRKQVKTDVLEELFNNYSTGLIETLCDPKQLFTGPDADDCNKISASVRLDGDRFKVIITKPNNSPILLGDVFKKQEVKDFIISDPNTPIVAAIDDIGRPILVPVSKKSKELYSALIGGGAGSGKSQFFASMAAQFVAFNKPEDLQMILVDPKGDTTFNKLALTPHVCRLIQGGNPEQGGQIYELIRKLVSEEAPRRQELFKKESCANIQDYKKKGKEMPFLIVFLDEFLSIRDAIEQWYKDKYAAEVLDYEERKANKEKGLVKPKKVEIIREFMDLMKVAVTKLRASGIYFFIISHRFTGSIDPTTRQLAAYRVVLRSEKLKTEVFEPSELKNFSKKLINAGDAAIKVGEGDVKSAKGMMVSMGDDETFKIFEIIAKTYYKLGVKIPDEIKVLGKDYIKDVNAIKKELYGDSEEIQFDGSQNEDNRENENDTLAEDVFNLDEDTEDNNESEDEDVFELNNEDNDLEDIEEPDEQETLDDIEKIDEDGTIHTKSSKKESKPKNIKTKENNKSIKPSSNTIKSKSIEKPNKNESILDDEEDDEFMFDLGEDEE